MRLPKLAARGGEAEATAISDRSAPKTEGWTRLRTSRWGRSVGLAAAALVVLAGCGGSQRPPVGPGRAFPGTPAGAQARWLFQALGRIPIPDAALRAHFAPSFLNENPPALINARLAGAGQLRLESVISTRPNLAVFVVANQGTQRFRVELPVDTHGRINGLQARELASGTGILAGPHPDPLAQPLIEMCHQAPCTNGQEFEIFDQAGAPIFSVAEYGGASVFGDNFRVWAPGTNLLTGTAAVTLSWEPPGEYDRQFKLPDGCAPPAIWESPQGIWKCTSSHKWKIALRF